MENLQYILSLAGAALGLFITTITFFAKFLTNKKAKKVAENVLKISEAMIPYIKQAEAFTNYSGAEKKEFVMTKANQFAIDHGIIFDANAVGNKIEEFVDLTKQVNKRECDIISIPNTDIADKNAAVFMKSI